MERIWQIAPAVSDTIRNSFPEIHPLVLQLLVNRGLSDQAEIDEFLNPDYGQDTHDPFLFRHMHRAIDRTMKAIEAGEKIVVHGDYDADGVCASAIMVSTLQALGADVSVYIPHRMSEGYGLNMNTVAELQKQKVCLVITVDCGISNAPEIAEAEKRGIDIIVTDHHEEPPSLPTAFAIINPSVAADEYPFRALAGSGVAFKFAQALIKEDAGKKLKEGFEKWLLDLVALGTIADMVPLIGENRTLTKYGLIVLRKTRRLGIQALAQSARINLPSVDGTGVGFGLVPRLNAAGRIDHANTAYELLMTEDSDEAKQVAENLDKNNKERQRVTESMVQESKRQLGEVGDARILFAMGKDWSAGLVGLVAGRIMDQFDRPVIVMGERDGEIMGSGRSIPGFDITAALVKSSQYLDRYGGHASACGFTLKPGALEAFKSSMTALAGEALRLEDLTKRLVVDARAVLADINWELVSQLEGFEPCGQGNPTVRLLAEKLEVVDFQKVGAEGKHLRLQVVQSGVTKKVIAFGKGATWGNDLSIGEMVDIVFELSINEWNGSRELQLKLVDMRKSNV
ncbi:MAG: single-stranded-DNA-specific exonuclease RecJ [Candidatus Kerfeldbacteria bacterium]|nr:single-stranded-DNA-specific exonuclease RecJ [Candidatus Kerfeldbacteria bacterium]